MHATCLDSFGDDLCYLVTEYICRVTKCGSCGVSDNDLSGVVVGCLLRGGVAEPRGRRGRGGGVLVHHGALLFEV